MQRRAAVQSDALPSHEPLKERLHLDHPVQEHLQRIDAVALSCSITFQTQFL